GLLSSKRSMLLQYILQAVNQSNSVRALQSAHYISDNQQAQCVPGAHCRPRCPHLLPLEKRSWWEVDWYSLMEERELPVFVRALKICSGTRSKAASARWHQHCCRCHGRRSSSIKISGFSQEIVEAEQELIELQKHVSAQGILVQDLTSD
ncbi:hypothetical protein EJB05_05665, partial [Eragrostis curvula]